MLSAFTTRFRSMIWFLIVSFVIYSTPHSEIFSLYKFRFAEAQAAEQENTAAQSQEQASEAEQAAATQESESSAQSSEKLSKEKKEKEDSTVKTQSLMSTGGGGIASALGFSSPTPDTLLFSGALAYKYPILVPPGRGNMAPNIAITYNSFQPNGWIGVGWGLDMGAIQRSTKRGVSYTANDYVAIKDGSTSELIARTDWGSDYYGAKIEGALSKYHKIYESAYPTYGYRWEVTSKDGTKYYYGSTPQSRQENGTQIFKWCLDKVQDTNGNYMTVTYTKDQGEIYLTSKKRENGFKSLFLYRFHLGLAA